LRREASNLPVSDALSAESLKNILNEAKVIDKLAQDAEFERPEYSSKRMMESFSNTSRSKKFRNVSDETEAEKEEE
jgi:hypothetical protein